MKPRFLPKFPIFVQDWMSSLRVQQMTCEEEGALLRLCLLQWQEGSLPADPEVLCRLARTRGQAAAYPVLISAFPLGADGLRRNEKVERVRAEAEAYCSEQARKASLGGKARARGLPQASPRCAPPTPTPTPTPTPNSDTPPTGAPAPVKPARSPRRLRLVADPEAELRGKASWIGDRTREWLAHRSEQARSKPYTPSGLRALIAKIEGWGEARAKAAVEHSMAGEFQGLYEPVGSNGHGGGQPARRGAARANAGAYENYWKVEPRGAAEEAL